MSTGPLVWGPNTRPEEAFELLAGAFTVLQQRQTAVENLASQTAENVGKIASQVDDIHHALIGDDEKPGQYGQVRELRKEVELLKERLERRTQNFRTWFIAYSVVLIPLIWTFLANHLNWK